MQSDKNDEELGIAELTAQLLVSLVYWLIILWIIPIAPMIIIWMFDLPLTVFPFLWLAGLPASSLVIYYFSKRFKSESALRKT